MDLQRLQVVYNDDNFEMRIVAKENIVEIYLENDEQDKNELRWGKMMLGKKMKKCFLLLVGSLFIFANFLTKVNYMILTQLDKLRR